MDPLSSDLSYKHTAFCGLEVLEERLDCFECGNANLVQVLVFTFLQLVDVLLDLWVQFKTSLKLLNNFLELLLCRRRGYTCKDLTFVLLLLPLFNLLFNYRLRWRLRFLCLLLYLGCLCNCLRINNTSCLFSCRCFF